MFMSIMYALRKAQILCVASQKTNDIHTLYYGSNINLSSAHPPNFKHYLYLWTVHQCMKSMFLTHIIISRYRLFVVIYYSRAYYFYHQYERLFYVCNQFK